MAMLVRDENILVQTSPIHDDGSDVQMGICVPSEVVLSPACKNFFKSIRYFCNSYIELMILLAIFPHTNKISITN